MADNTQVVRKEFQILLDHTSKKDVVTSLFVLCTSWFLAALLATSMVESCSTMTFKFLIYKVVVVDRASQKTLISHFFLFESTASGMLTAVYGSAFLQSPKSG